MDLLMEMNHFAQPDIRSLETVLEYGIRLNAGRVFADVWDLEMFSGCKKCTDKRTNRLISLNLNQKITSPVRCTCSPQ